jgi:hypothetical protein
MMNTTTIPQTIIAAHGSCEAPSIAGVSTNKPTFNDITEKRIIFGMDNIKQQVVEDEEVTECPPYTVEQTEVPFTKKFNQVVTVDSTVTIKEV